MWPCKFHAYIDVTGGVWLGFTLFWRSCIDACMALVWIASRVSCKKPGVSPLNRVRAFSQTCFAHLSKSDWCCNML